MSNEQHFELIACRAGLQQLSIGNDGSRWRRVRTHRLLRVPKTVFLLPTDATHTKRRRRQCERGQKHGKHGSIRTRLWTNSTRPAIPSLMLSNVRPLENNLDLIQLSQSTQYETRDCCVFVFTETWLNDNIPDSAIHLHGLSNAKDALRELYSAISEQQTNNPDGVFIIAGDFNHANLKTVLPKFY